MRDILLDEPAGTMPVDSFLIYGDTRSGKTEFAATFPRPLIIADATEGGYATIRRMDRGKWFEDGVAPIIKAIDTMNDLAKLSSEVDQLIAQGKVCTIVFDAFSFYCDFYLAQLLKLQAKPDNRQAYGQLGVHLREVRTNYHAKGVNTVWLCLAKHPDTDDPKGRPMIPGQQADKFSAGVSFLFHSQKEQRKEGGKIVEEIYNLRTKQFGNYIVGNRLGQDAHLLPDPFSGTYAEFMEALGYDVAAIRRGLKPLAKPVVAAKPLVITQRPAAPAVQVKR